MSRIKVIVVDDEVPIRENLRLFSWSLHDFELVGEARHGQEALEMCHSRLPDIIVTDIMMPVMDGLQLTRKLKEWRQDIQIIMLTCHSEFDFAREALVLGACDYLLKGTYRDEDLLGALIKAKSRLPDKGQVDSDKRYEIRMAMAYIREHLNEPFSMQSVADHVGLSPNYFGSLFRKETAYSFHDYVKRERLEKAAQLLCGSNMKVYEVAIKTGFANYRYFTDVFYKQYGLTPREYRVEHG
ncbi:response regulator [Cohnella sp.]|uniref:response regulator transcription factor n=1 Tax=Cohnella sp. TaxID=1883426 RepID=UPI0035625500